jgi:hypothetical protein
MMMNKTCQRNPERFVRGRPTIELPPKVAAINLSCCTQLQIHQVTCCKAWISERLTTYHIVANY